MLFLYRLPLTVDQMYVAMLDEDPGSIDEHDQRTHGQDPKCEIKPPVKEVERNTP